MHPLYPRSTYEPENFVEEKKEKIRKFFILLYIFFAVLAAKEIVANYLQIVLEEGRQIRVEREIKPPPPWH
ncbi:MAG: hypothetical protein GX765_04175 [Candidatus Moranbacteria bacterium]|nr:hypothetical protein [Candidatus Moranbacteria bacterium]